jgi:hypothetical protein
VKAVNLANNHIQDIESGVIDAVENAQPRASCRSVRMAITHIGLADVINAMTSQYSATLAIGRSRNASTSVGHSRWEWLAAHRVKGNLFLIYGDHHHALRNGPYNPRFAGCRLGMAAAKAFSIRHTQTLT